MSRAPGILALLALAALVQATLAGAVTVHGVKPSVVLVLVYVLAISGGEGRGILYGAAGGLAEDIFSAGPTGLMLSGFALVGYLAGRIGRSVTNVGELAASIGILALSLVQGAYTAAVLSSLVGGYDFASALLYTALPQALYNAAFGAAAVWFIGREGSWPAARVREFLDIRPDMEHELL